MCYLFRWITYLTRFGQELREIHTSWLEQREEEQKDPAAVQGPGDEDVVTVEAPAEVETPVAFAPQDLPLAIDIGIPPLILRGIEYPSVLYGVDTSPATPTNDRITAASSPTLTISTLSDLTPTELDDSDDNGEDNCGHIPLTYTRHETFYLEDGNVEVVCGRTIFRIHSSIVSFSSSKLRDVFSPSAILNAPMPEGCPRITSEDSPEDFTVLLKVICTPGFVPPPLRLELYELTGSLVNRFPARHKVPDFTTFASLLRMATKYGFSDIREGLVEDLKAAYPTKWEDFVAARVLGEDIFGSPKPHPNAVLNLLSEQNIKFALPFAAYRACLGGFSALVNDEPGTALPRLTLASIINGTGAINRKAAIAAHAIVYLRDLGVCPDKSCVLNVDIDSTQGRRDALSRIFGIAFARSARDMLSPLSLETVVCVNCAKPLEKANLNLRSGFFWTALPSLFGLGSWEEV